MKKFTILPPDQEEAFIHINMLFDNHFKERETLRLVTIVPIELSTTAQYMARYGLKNMNSLVQAPGIIEDLRHFLQRDMEVFLGVLARDILNGAIRGTLGQLLHIVETRKGNANVGISINGILDDSRDTC
ncbi:hypothetical protein AgCh_009266 [Apium graveolens]